MGKEKEDLKSKGQSQKTQVESENASHSDLSRNSTSDCLHSRKPDPLTRKSVLESVTNTLSQNLLGTCGQLWVGAVC